MPERTKKTAMTTRVFINGCFDVLHAGHVALIQYAASLGTLTVAVNVDESVRRLKGGGRPIIPENDRLYVVGAIQGVHDAVLFRCPTPEALLKRMYVDQNDGPHIVVKGSEYSDVFIPEREIVERHGGKIVFYNSGLPHSTSRIINACQDLGRR